MIDNSSNLSLTKCSNKFTDSEDDSRLKTVFVTFGRTLERILYNLKGKLLMQQWTDFRASCVLLAVNLGLNILDIGAHYRH